jgi:cell division protein FtsB
MRRLKHFTQERGNIMKSIIKVMAVIVVSIIVIAGVYGYNRYTALVNTVQSQNQEISELKESNKALTKSNMKLTESVNWTRNTNRMYDDGDCSAKVYDDNGKPHNIIIRKGLVGYSVIDCSKEK